MKTANPYLTFSGDAEDAFAFYQSVFGGDFTSIVRFRDMEMVHKDEMSEAVLNRIAHIVLPLGANDVLLGSDTIESMGSPLRKGNNFSIYVGVENVDEGGQLFDALSAGGDVTMPYEESEWAERFGMCVDKFGVQWMVEWASDEHSA